LFQEFQATLSSSNPSEAASVCRVPKSTTIRPPKRPKKYWNNTPKFQQVPHESSVVSKLGNPGCFTNQGYKPITKWVCPKVGYPKKPTIDHLPHQKWPFWGYTPNVGQIGRHIQVCLTWAVWRPIGKSNFMFG
jgi:hypothetical protein